MIMELTPAERASFTCPNGACFNYTTTTVFERCFTQWRYISFDQSSTACIDFTYTIYTSFIDL